MSFTLVQISDLHLPEPPATEYRGRDARGALERVLEAVARLSPAPDLLLLGGDNVHHGGRHAYEQLAARLDRIGMSWRWLPGNHDDAALMAAVRGEAMAAPAVPGWQVLLLDSTACPDGRGGGSLTAESLQALRQAAALDAPLLVALHHNPIPTGGWQDAIALGAAEAFWACLDPRRAPTLILCGHLHHVVSLQRGRARVLSAPSTVVQFRPGTRKLELETDGERALPGFRVLVLEEDGSWRSRVIRIR